MSDHGPLICGVDPGAAGGLALLSADGRFQVAYPMPETERDLADLLGEYAPHIQLAWLEAAHSMPGQGVASTFAFGRNYGVLRGLLIALQIPFQDVSPVVWTRGLGLRRKGRARAVSYNDRKKLHRAFAQQWFPKLKITHKTADALLIAEYGRRTDGKETR